MKRGITPFLSLSLFFALIIGIMTPIGLVKAEVSDEVGVIVNGHSADFDVPPRVENDRTLVPLRKIFEMLGATVNWEDSSSTATATKAGITITIKFDGLESHNVIVNGKTVAIGVSPLEVPPKIVNDRVLVPLRFVSEAMGATVNFDQDMNTVFIVTPFSLGMPEKITQFSLSKTNGRYMFLNDLNTFITYQVDNNVFHNFTYYNPETKTQTPLPFQATSFGIVKNKICYVNKGENEVHIFDPVTVSEAGKISFPIKIFEIYSTGNDLLLVAVSDTDSTKGGKPFMWNTNDEPSRLRTIDTPHEGSYTYLVIPEPIAGLFFYEKTLISTNQTKNYVVNSKNGKSHGYAVGNGMIFISVSPDGKDIMTSTYSSFHGNPMIQDGTLKGWVDSDHVLYYKSGVLAVHDLNTDQFIAIDANVYNPFVMGNKIFYLKIAADGTYIAYDVPIH